MTDHLIETLEDGVATLTMNRPEARNALSGPMMAALSVERLRRRPSGEGQPGEKTNSRHYSDFICNESQSASRTGVLAEAV